MILLNFRNGYFALFLFSYGTICNKCDLLLLDIITTGSALLSSVLPPLERCRYSGSQSSTKSTSRSYPSRIVEWVDFHPSVTNFHELDNISLAVSPVIFADKTVINESTLESKFIICCAEYLNTLGTYIGTMRKRSSNVSRSILCQADVICTNDEDNLFALGELKTFWNLEKMPHSAAELECLYSQMTPYNPELENHHRKWWRCIAQTNGYMMDQGVKYGFISCFNHTWFMKACAGGAVSMSPAYACNGGDYFKAFAYFMYAAKRDRTKHLSG